MTHCDASGPLKQSNARMCQNALCRPLLNRGSKHQMQLLHSAMQPVNVFASPVAANFFKLQWFIIAELISVFAEFCIHESGGTI